MPDLEGSDLRAACWTDGGGRRRKGKKGEERHHRWNPLRQEPGSVANRHHTYAFPCFACLT